MEITGTIKVLGNSEKVSDKLTKMQIVLTTDEQYPQDLAIEFLNDKIDTLKNFKVGDKVVIGINLRGREYNGKYYNNIVGWRVASELTEVTNNQQQPAREVIDEF